MYLYKKLQMTEFVTVAIFNFPHEILVLKSILENENIPHLFLNENLIGTNPMASIAYGGIQLKVHPNDFQTVRSIIDQLSDNDHLKIV